MHMTAAVHSHLDSLLDFLHGSRRGSLLFAVRGLLACSILTLTAIGRSLSDRRGSKHRIKRVDRLLGNSLMQADVAEVCEMICEMLLANKSKPVILVDATKVPGKQYALTASIAIGGRAVPLYWLVHSEKKLGSAKVNNRFLRELATILPADCRPVIVTDAGFHAPWFQEVERLGWDYVGRIRGLVKYSRQEANEWNSVKDLYAKAQLKPKDLGLLHLSKAHHLQTRAVIVRNRKKPGRKKAVHVTKQKPGPRPKSQQNIAKRKTLTEQNDKARQAAKEPWLLVTSLTAATTNKVVKIYSKRMQTEETYRDIKTTRFGLSLEQSGTHNPKRLSVLLLIAALATIVLITVGSIAEQLGLHYRFQANTIKNRRVLSLFRLGLELITLPELWEEWFDPSRLQIEIAKEMATCET